MFDIMSLGDTSFEDGLGEILGNGNILKVSPSLMLFFGKTLT